eukprot:6205555-Pleurochrysis_carterae.AAC.1
MKQESKEALTRDYSDRIASFLATAMRPKAGLKLRKLQVLYMGERLEWLISLLLPTALAGDVRARVRELIGKKQLENLSRVIEDTMRLIELAYRPVQVSAAHKSFNKKGKKAISAATATQKHDPTAGAGCGAPGRKPPHELNNGQQCLKETCYFAHDK